MIVPRCALPTQLTAILGLLILSACSDSATSLSGNTTNTTQNEIAPSQLLTEPSNDLPLLSAATDSDKVLQRLQVNNASDPSSGDHLGSSLAANGKGQVLIAGSPGRDSMGFVDSGSISVMFLVDEQWWFDRELVAEFPQTAASFGHSVALSNDGNLIAASAPADNLAAEAGGAVYLFERFGEGWVGTTQLVSPTPTSFAQFGIQVLMHPTRSTVFVAERSAQGKVHVFNHIQGQWEAAQTLQAPVDKNALATQQADRFGTALAITAEGSLVVGAPGRLTLNESDGSITSGAVYTFSDNGTQWELDQILEPTDNAWLDFGSTLAVADNGTLLLVGVADYPVTDMPLLDKAQMQVQLYGVDTDQQWRWQQSLTPTGTHSEVSSLSLVATATGERIYMAMSNPERRDNTLMQYDLIADQWVRTELYDVQQAQVSELGQALALLPDDSGVVVTAPAATTNGQRQSGAIYTW